MTTQNKAYRKRTITGTVIKILLAFCILVAAVGVGVRFLLPQAWQRGEDRVESALENPLLSLFERIASEYVDKAVDLGPAEQKAWKRRFHQMASVFRDASGSNELRGKLRAEYDRIVDDMTDGDLTASELAPRREPVDQLLKDIEVEEAVMDH